MDVFATECGQNSVPDLQLSCTRHAFREKFMNDFNDDLFAFINDEIIEFSIRELIDYQFNLRILDDSTNYTKEEKINFMKNLIADIEKCISIIEKDEHAR